MVTRLYSIKDNKVGSFGTVHACNNKVDVIRELEQVVNEPTNKIGMYPEDFDLYMIAEFDMETGKITPTTNPEFVTNCYSLKRNGGKKDEG